MECKHENFLANVTVNRLEDSGGFIADINIACSQCKLPFHFEGVQYGLSFKVPRVGADATELRAPIAPGPVLMPLGSGAVFEMPEKPAQA